MRTLNTVDGVPIVKNQELYQLRYMRRLYGIPFIFVVRYAWYHPKVRTQYGIIEGKVVSTHIGPNTEVEQFLGIPYALPPVGDRGFEYPKPSVTYPNGELIIYLIIICL